MSPLRPRLPGRLLLCVAVLLLAQLACGPGAIPIESGAPPPSPVAHSPTAGVVPSPPASPATPAPAITEARFVEIEWPVAVRVGDSDFIRLSLVPGAEGSLVPTAEVEGHLTEGEPIEIPDLYATHNVLAVAELSAVGLEIDRPGQTAQALLPGQAARWTWTVAPRSAGRHVAILALGLRFVPKAGGEPSERAVWARRLSIEGRTVLGLSGRAADVLGVAGSVVGAVLGFPFADKFYGWLWRRIVRRKA